ncbi:MAG: DegT/DnrJ/EryC1/StrS aminotransferase family protein [SAR324 cluster bacterium]|nr:DegT/DnrJ/EryC1/StrS aminotransferase family protein [SAR324 cluster bacterium]
MNDPIPFIDLQAQRRRIETQIDSAIARVLAHGSYILGPEVAELERLLAEFAGVKHAITCSSGTDALLLPLMAWGIGPGDAVFVPAFTFVATAEAVALVGATPVFVDVLADTFNMDPASLEKAIEALAGGELRPKAIIPVDLFGQPADYDRIIPIAERFGLKLLADTAQGFGASLHGKRTGGFGHMAAASFFPAKPLGCYGDGGAVFTNSDDEAELLRSLLNHGQGRDRYQNVRIGINGRLDTLQAAILIEKLKIFDDEIEARGRIAERYSRSLGEVARVPILIPGARSVWAQYTLRIPHRDAVAARLRDRGIPTAIYYPIPLNRQEGYRHFPTVPGGLPVSDDLAQEVVSLPMHPYLQSPIQDRIINAVSEASS